jgi:pimeloyl-ACP methyl ester carboxylesterase
MRSLHLPAVNAFLRYFDLPGKEPARVYIHGLGCASSADFPQVIVLPHLKGFRSVLVDLLGFGFSDRPENFDYTLEDHAGTVAALLRHLELSGCALVGHSMGGSVAITLTAEHPELVSALVVAEGNLDPGAGAISAEITSYGEREYQRTGHEKVLAGVIEEAGRGDPGMAAYATTFQFASPLAIYRSAAGLLRGTRPTMRQRLAGFDIPRAYVFGELNLPDQQRLAGGGADVLVIHRAGHAMMEENPEGFARVVGGWLNEVS